MDPMVPIGDSSSQGPHGGEAFFRERLVKSVVCTQEVIGQSLPHPGGAGDDPDGD